MTPKQQEFKKNLRSGNLISIKTTSFDFWESNVDSNNAINEDQHWEPMKDDIQWHTKTKGKLYIIR